MNMPSDSVILINAIVAVTGAAPFVGDQGVLSGPDFEMPGRIDFVEINEDTLTPRPGSHGSRLAFIGFAAPASLAGKLTRDRQACHIELRHPETRETLAAGLTIDSRPGDLNALHLPSTATAVTIWLTGLSGAGKSTIAAELRLQLEGRSRVQLLDGDIVRTHICKGLGFTREDRDENVRRLAVTARAFAEHGSIAIVSAISPYRHARQHARSTIGRFIEVYVNAPLATCEERDVKGLYRKARNGELTGFTGLDDPYEPPLDPEVECRTDLETVEQSVATIIAGVELYERQSRWPAESTGDRP